MANDNLFDSNDDAFMNAGETFNRKAIIAHNYMKLIQVFYSHSNESLFSFTYVVAFEPGNRLLCKRGRLRNSYLQS